MIGSGSHDVLNSSWLIHFQRQEKQSFIKYDLNKNGTLDFQVGATVSLWLVVEGPLFCLLIYMASVSNIDYHLTIFGLEFGKSFLENSWGWFVWCMNALQWSNLECGASMSILALYASRALQGHKQVPQDLHSLPPPLCCFPKYCIRIETTFSFAWLHAITIHYQVTMIVLWLYI